jgi:DNA-binding MarR family transcriptional regulator
VPRAADLARVDELLQRLVRSVRRPAYRDRILQGVSRIPGAEALRVLRSVELREQRGEPASISDVAGDLEVEQSTASRAVNGVVDRELVIRNADATDLRRTLLTLSDDGRTALDRASANRMELITDLTADWSAAELRDFARLLEKFVARYEVVEAPSERD